MALTSKSIEFQSNTKASGHLVSHPRVTINTECFSQENDVGPYGSTGLGVFSKTTLDWHIAIMENTRQNTNKNELAFYIHFSLTMGIF